MTDDLWAQLDKISATPISGLAHDFTLQEGIPLIRVTSARHGIRLAQDRFTADGTIAAPSIWHVPVVEKNSRTQWHGLISRDAPADIALAKGAVPIVNAGQAGYFRTLYDKPLAAKLAANFRKLGPADQLGLLNDGRALGYSGAEPLTNLLALANRARPGMAPEVLTNILEQIAELDTFYRDLPGRSAFRTYGLRVLRPIFAKIGWTAKPGENENVALLRSKLIDALSELDDPAVIAAARQRFAAYVKDQASLTGELRSSVLSVAAAHADTATWEQLHVLARTAPTSLEKREFYALLGSAHDRTLANRALDLALTDEAPITMRPAVVASVSAYYPQMAFDFATSHIDAINAALEPDSRNEFVPDLARSSHDPAMAAKLHAYAEAHIPETARRSAVISEATIAYSAMVRSKRLPEIDRWLKGRR